jgi:Tfp pilus assembly protein PilF
MQKEYEMRRTWLTGSSGVLVFLMLAGCASTGRKPVQNFTIPPGLDSTTVVLAGKLADETFVSGDRERQAQQLSDTGKQALEKVDAFCEILEKDLENQPELNKDDQAQFDRELAKGERALERWKELSRNNSDKNPATEKEALFYCTQAQEHLEQALRINPFDKNARILLAMAYYNLQHIFGKQENHQKAIEVLERLTRIEKGEHHLFRLLAENYLALKQFEHAILNFKKAQTVLIKTSFEAPPDTATLFYYLYAQSDAYARVYDAVTAIKGFKTTIRFAQSAQESTDVKNYLNWINWDGGNIRASEQWDEIIALEHQKNYPQLARQCTQLLPDLKTSNAQILVNHKLAVAEFEFLDRKDAAIERMRALFENLNAGAPQQTQKIFPEFFNTYGAMLYRLGIEARDRQDKKLALAYFTKSASFEWDQMARSHIELVTLLWNDPKLSIFYGKKALEASDGLSAMEKCELLSLMVRAHKSAGNYDEAREYFNKWKTCSNRSSAKKLVNNQ